MPEQPLASQPTINVIESCRSIYRKAADQYVDRGAEVIETAIGCVYAAHDLAMAAGNDAHGAIEWLRSATDLMERQLMEAQSGRAKG